VAFGPGASGKELAVPLGIIVTRDEIVQHVVERIDRFRVHKIALMIGLRIGFDAKWS
jgi:hypothetical protein